MHPGAAEEDVGRASGASLRGALLVWIGTPLLFYMYVAPPMSHACSAFAVALFVTVWLHVPADVDDGAGDPRSGVGEH